MTISILAGGSLPYRRGLTIAALRAALFRPFRRTSQPQATCGASAELLDRAAIGFGPLDHGGRWLAANATLTRWLAVDAGHRDAADPAPAEGLPAVAPQSAPSGDLTESEETDGRFALSSPQCGEAEVWVAPLRCEPGHRHRFPAVAQLRQSSPPMARSPEIAAGAVPEALGRFFADAPVGIAVVDRASHFLQANGALGALLGADPQALAGQRLTDWLHPDDHNGVLATLDAAADRAEDRAAVEIRLAPPLERTLVMLCRFAEAPVGKPNADATPPGDRDGGDGLTLYFIDVTERKQLEAQFAQSLKMQAVGQLAGGVAHDFNNLLTAMIGFCDLLLLRSRPGDPSFADLMQIKQNANRAANLVRQLLAFSRQQSLQPRVLDVTDVLVELSHLLRRLIGENIELEFIHGRDLGLVEVDQGQLEQVVINLAVNARDAMPDGGRLTIRTENCHLPQSVRRGHETIPAGDYVLVDVADTGHGIAPEHLARIFEPFFSTKAAGSGTGLGLSTVYGIVKQTGGFVFVDSVRGSGTRLSIYLPRHRAVAGAVPRPDEAEAAIPRDLTGSCKIVLVEDDDAVRMFGARALRNKGYQVVEAKSGEAALDLIRGAAGSIELLITDVVMPQMDGPSLVREVRALDPAIKVIFMSGYAEEAFRQRLDRDPAIDFLAKPFTLKELAAKVKEVATRDRDIGKFSRCAYEQNRYNGPLGSRCAAAPAVK
jgi:two-component system, cell cycle sensor histidine kinase and response regulator CckA